MGSYETVRNLMPELSGDIRTSWFKFLPFAIALAHRDKARFDAALEYLDTVASHPAAHSATLLDLVQGKYAPFDIVAALKYAVYKNNREYLQDLLNFHEKYLPYPDNTDYESLVREAVGYHIFGQSQSQLNCLSLILDFKPAGKSVVTRQILSRVCDHGTESMIQDVLSRIDKSINDGTILTLPIFIAVRSGGSVAVSAVLDAGADVTIQVKSNIPSIEKDMLSPLDVAIHKHSIAVIDTLLKRGAGPVPHISEWPTHSRTYYHLHGIISRDTGAKLPSLKNFRRLTNQARKAIAY